MLHNQIRRAAEQLEHICAASRADQKTLGIAARNLRAIADAVACLEAHFNHPKEDTHAA